MNEEQQIRAVAAQAAATLMSQIKPPPHDYLFVANFVTEFIRDGWDAALLAVGDVPVAIPEQVAEDQAPAPMVEEREASDTWPPVRHPPGPPSTGLIASSVDAMSDTSSKQGAGRLHLERVRKQRAEAIMKQAEQVMNELKMAKAEGHKRRLEEKRNQFLAEAQDCNLADYAVVIKGEPTTLGSYLGSLQGS